MDSTKREDRLKDCLELSLVSYIRGLGYPLDKHGRVYRMLSPFTDENEPSFYVYPDDNYFVDFSSGVRGDIIDFTRAIHQCGYYKAQDIILGATRTLKFDPIKVDKKPKKRRKFELEGLLTDDPDIVKAITEYAESRGIRPECYLNGQIVVKDPHGDLSHHACMIFPHYGSSGKVTGAKARLIDNEDQRFSARGRLGWYILESDEGLGLPRLYITESETSSAALYAYLKDNQVNFVILCIGGVNSIPPEIPKEYRNLSNRYVVIDYDGSEEKYRERLQGFEHFKCKDVKIQVEKGEDVNSLYVKGMISKYASEILK